MVTGDGVTTAESVAAMLGSPEVHGEVKPQDKLALAEREQAEGKTVAMAGEGINDSPALTKANAGIAMGTGTSPSIRPTSPSSMATCGIARVRVLSLEAVRNMRRHLGFAFVHNALGIPLAAGLRYPFTGRLLSAMIAALAMNVSSVSVITNALRLRGTGQ
jgi:P-type Cu+ transporter